MAQTRKYANLPDLDIEAPDVYETPELTEDASTALTSTTHLQSPTFSSEESDDDSSRIDRRKLNTDQARNRFGPARVNATNADFSDRLPPHRRSYRTGTYRRRRGGLDSETELGDFSDEEDESLERKLARLRREVEEVKLEFEHGQQLKAQTKPDDDDDDEEEEGGGGDGSDDEGKGNKEDGPTEEIRKLSDALDAIYVQRHGVSKGAEVQFQQAVEKFAAASAAPAQLQTSFSSSVVGLPKQQQEHILAKAAEFDERLAQLEQALGLNAATMPDVADKPPKPILHALGDLEHQIAAISSTNPTTIEAVGAKVRRLNQEVQEASSPISRDREQSSTSGDGGSAYEDDPERVAKINALYGTLPTIESLSPTLPLVLERLRTLRMIHASAGNASSTLDEIEKRQAEQAGELKQWREALEKMETKLQEGEGVLTGNVKLVGDWVKDLEARVAKFS